MGIKSLNITELNSILKSAKTQPRVPAGSSRGGEFTSGSGVSGGGIAGGEIKEATIQSVRQSLSKEGIPIGKAQSGTGRINSSGAFIEQNKFTGDIKVYHLQMATPGLTGEAKDKHIAGKIESYANILQKKGFTVEVKQDFRPFVLVQGGKPSL